MSKIPKFRGNRKDVVQDALDFIEECEALFQAYLLHSSRWNAAILTELRSVDRQRASENLGNLP